jgi:hypothetical protein
VRNRALGTFPRNAPARVLYSSQAIIARWPLGYQINRIAGDEKSRCAYFALTQKGRAG